MFIVRNYISMPTCYCVCKNYAVYSCHAVWKGVFTSILSQFSTDFRNGNFFSVWIMQKMQNLTENHPADIRMVPGLKVEKNFLIQFIFIAGILFIGAINSFNSVIGALSAILFIFFLCSAFLKNHKKIMLIIVIFSIVMHFYPLLFQIKKLRPIFCLGYKYFGKGRYRTTSFGWEPIFYNILWNRNGCCIIKRRAILD